MLGYKNVLCTKWPFASVDLFAAARFLNDRGRCIDARWDRYTLQPCDHRNLRRIC